jgi:glycosyltransferase involved in cell wall biosynthesis
MSNIKISVVIPVMNEERNIKLLVQSIDAALKAFTHEIIFIDDGSTDNTVEQILKLKSSNIQLIEFSKNYGQTSAMAAGIEQASGEYIATIDGDLQNDPTDIPVMLKKLQTEGLDIVVGRRAKRKDGFILRKIPSKAANYIIKRLLKVNVTDSGCTLKVFKARIAKKLDLYGELHRLIPILASMHGAKIAEMDVKHHARQHGISKYGTIGRTFRVISDIITMLFFARYKQKPMHLFGGIGVGLGLIGGIICSYLLALKLFGYTIGNRPLFFVGILLITAAIQFITTGFIAELLIRTYYAIDKKKPYTVTKVYKGGKQIIAEHETRKNH